MVIGNAKRRDPRCGFGKRLARTSRWRLCRRPASNASFNNRAEAPGESGFHSRVHEAWASPPVSKTRPSEAELASAIRELPLALAGQVEVGLVGVGAGAAGSRCVLG